MRYRVPSTHPAPAAVRAVLDDVAATSVPSRCRELLAGLPGGDEVVVVRHLDLRVVVRGSTAATSSVAVGDAWGRGLANAVRRALSADPDPRWLVRYPSPAHRVACLLDDVARGRAATRWEHESFRPLLGGRPGSVVMKVLAAHARTGGSATAALAVLSSDSALARVAATVDDSDLSALVALLVAEADGADSAIGPGEARALVDAWRCAGPFAAAPAPLTLHLLAQLAAAVAAPSAAAVRGAAEIAQAIPAWLDSGNAPPPTILATVAARAGLDPDAWRPAAPPLRADDGEEDEPMVAATPWGGLLLAVPDMVGLDEVLARHFPNRRDTLRWLVLLALLPESHRRGARHDPVVALAAGCPRVPSADDVAALVAEVDASSARMAVRDVRARFRRETGAPLGRVRPTDRRHLDVGSVIRSPVTELVSLVAVTSLALLRLFTRHLPHFAAGRPAYVAANFLIGRAIVDVAADGLRLDLPDVPLRLVLVLAGWPGDRREVPWLPGGRIIFEREL